MTTIHGAGHLVLVSGATGKQGGAVARNLLARGFRVRALTRDPGGQGAKALAEQGCEIVPGDLDDRSSIDQALHAVHGVFSVQNFFEAGYDGEVRQGKALADAAKEAGVAHFVYSSVDIAHRDTGIPHFESKWEIEEHVRKIALPATILRPAGFMQNWEPMRELILDGTFAQPLDPHRVLQQVDVEDIGVFAAMSFADPQHWIGRQLVLAGDEPTMTEMAETFSRVTGRKVRYRQVPWDQATELMSQELVLMYRWFNDVGYQAQFDVLRAEHPELTSLEQYLRGHGWEGAGRV